MKTRSITPLFISQTVRAFVARHMPGLGPLKRYIVAQKHHLAVKPSYSQHGEDQELLAYTQSGGFDLDGAIYVDVGANHPTDISNTYLLYRAGFHGVAVEPNRELCRLFEKFRPRDTVLNLGCSDRSGVFRFNVSNTPVLSSFVENWRDADIYASYYVPVLRLDDALRQIECSYVFLLSIDVEGLNEEVLRGAAETLARTLLVCIEWDEENDIKTFGDILGPGFTYLKSIGCNALFENTALAAGGGRPALIPSAADADWGIPLEA